MRLFGFRPPKRLREWLKISAYLLLQAVILAFTFLGYISFGHGVILVVLCMVWQLIDGLEYWQDGRRLW